MVMFESTIKINAEAELADAISQALEPEKEFKTERANYSVQRKDKLLTIKIKAKDATAFRAATSSITALISIVEKIWRDVKESL